VQTNKFLFGGRARVESSIPILTSCARMSAMAVFLMLKICGGEGEILKGKDVEAGTVFTTGCLTA